MIFLNREVVLADVKPSDIKYNINKTPRNTDDIIVPVFTVDMVVEIGDYQETLVFRAESETLYEEPILYCDRTGRILSDLWQLEDINPKVDIQQLQTRFANLFHTSPSTKEIEQLKQWLDSNTPVLSDFIKTSPKEYIYNTKPANAESKDYDDLVEGEVVYSVQSK